MYSLSTVLKKNQTGILTWTSWMPRWSWQDDSVGKSACPTNPHWKEKNQLLTPKSYPWPHHMLWHACTHIHTSHTHALTHAPITFLKFYQFFENFTANFDHIHSQLLSITPLIYIVPLVPNFKFFLFLSNPLIPIYVANIFIGLRPFTEMWSA